MDYNLKKAVEVAWLVEAIEKTSDDDAPKVKLIVALTDETGATTHEQIGEYLGTCQPSQRTPHLKDAIWAIRCVHETTGYEIEVVKRRGELIFLRAPHDAADDVLSFEERGKVTLPAGAGVTVLNGL